MSEVVIVRGEKPTKEEKEEIKAARVREKVRASARRRKEKWLFLSTKENLTEEERVWMEKWEIARVKNLSAASLRYEKKIEAIRTSGWVEEGAIKEKRKEARKKRRERWLYLLNLSERTVEEQLEFDKRRPSEERKNKKMAEWLSANAEEQRERVKQRRKIRAATDPAFACLITARARMKEVLRGIKKQSTQYYPDRFQKYFGCDKKSLVSYIESQFRDGMTWENRGKVWELDHVVPLSAGLGNADLLMRMNHYRNLKPLTIEENRRKGSSMPEVWPEGVSFTYEEVVASYEKYLSEKVKAQPKVTKKTKAVSVSQEG